MRNRISWLILSCFMVAALVLASCAPAAKPTAPATPTAPTTPTTPTAPTKPMVEPTKPITVEKPKYGGTITVNQPAFLNFDTYRFNIYTARILSFAGERLVTGDWAVDRNLWSFPTSEGVLPAKYITGLLVESWETPDPLTIILHVRQGIHFQDKPPVNGRELTADDIIWNIERVKKSPFVDRVYLDLIESINKKDKWTVELRLRPPPQVGLVRNIFDQNALVFWPKEVMGKSGEIEDWHNIIGTGPFMIEDYVPDSAVTFKRNPNYYLFDERHPEYRLPYADFAKILLIPDPSTQTAAVRTGKIDWVCDLLWQDAEGLKRTAPRLLSRGVPARSPILFPMRNDIAPFNDVRVRQAMNMAIDRNEIIKSFYGGYATYYIAGLSELNGNLYTPYEKLPDKPMWTTVSCKEILTYNPKKAKELLAEAGYPNGFKTHIDTSYPRDPGLSEILQSYLAKIGVEAQINAQEYAAYQAMKYGKQNTAIILQWGAINPDPLYYLTWFSTPASINNPGCIDDRYFQDLFWKAMSEFDDAKREKMAIELDYRRTEMAYCILFPHDQQMIMWQPWLKGYAGEGPLAKFQLGSLYAHVWIDQELKKSLGF